MSGHYPARSAIWAAAAIIVLAIAACSSTSTTASTGTSASAVASIGPNQATGQALVAMLDWLTHDGQASAAANGYVPLPSQIQQLARTMLQQITGPTGARLLS
jgi:hypothetical protein